MFINKKYIPKDEFRIKMALNMDELLVREAVNVPSLEEQARYLVGLRLKDLVGNKDEGEEGVRFSFRYHGINYDVTLGPVLSREPKKYDSEVCRLPRIAEQFGYLGRCFGYEFPEEFSAWTPRQQAEAISSFLGGIGLGAEPTRSYYNRWVKLRAPVFARFFCLRNEFRDLMVPPMALMWPELRLGDVMEIAEPLFNGRVDVVTLLECGTTYKDFLEQPYFR